MNLRNIFKRKIIKTLEDIHECNFYKVVGKYYYKDISPYINSNHSVKVYVRKECDCGKSHEFLLHKQEFKYYSSCEIDNYIKKLEKMGLDEELVFKLKLLEKENIN